MTRYSITALLMCWLTLVSAQQPWHQHITTYDGLPSNTVYWMMQDSRDYLWMGTEGGLVRYDGKNFKTYNDYPDLTSYDFNSVHEDSKGNIWSHNFANQIVRVRGDSMTVFENDWFVKGGNYIEMVVSDRDDIYVRNANEIVRYFPEQDTFENIYSNPADLNMYYLTYAEGVLSVMMDNSRKFFRYNEQGDTFDVLPIPKKKMRLKAFQLTAQQTFITDVLNIPEVIYTIRNDSFVVFDNLAKYDLPESFKINNIKKLRTGDIWYCTNKGIYRQRDGLRLLPGVNTSNIIIDKEDNLWVSALSEGVFVFPDLNVDLYTPDNSELYISDPACIAFDEAQNLFIGTVSGKVLHWDTKRKKIITEYKRSIASRVSHIYYDSLTQYIWADGFFKFKKGKSQCEQERRSTAIKQAFALPNGEMLIRESREQLFQIKKSSFKELPLKPFSKNWTQHSTDSDKFYMLKDDIFQSPINTIHYDTKADKIWLALGNRTMINTRDTTYEFFGNKNKSIVSNCFEQSPDNSIWIGVKGGGFVAIREDSIHFDARNKVFKDYGDIRLIKCTEKYIWLLAETHLLVTDYQGQILSRYSAAMGIEANNITDILVAANKAWLCTKKGLIYINFEPQQFGKPPLPVIQDIVIQGITQPMSIQDSIRQPDHYNFPYHKNTLNIKFASISPYTKAHFEYQYQLKGADEDWRITSTNNAYYPHLSSNAYTFELRTLGKNNQKSEVVRFDIQIEKPYWQNAWFILLFALGIAAILFWLYYKNEQRKTKRNYYDQQLRSSQLTALKTQMNPHFMFNALNSIQEFIILNEKRLANEYLGKFSHLMRVYLNHSSKDWVPLEEEIQALKIYLDLEKLRFEQAQIQLNIDPKLEIEHIRIPPLFVQPYIENAFKHGLLHKPNDRKLDISLNKIPDNTLQIIIKDNGVGRKKAMEIKNKRTNKNLSFSITANQKRLQLLNYNKQQQIEVEIIDLQENNRTAGTKVIIRIPNYDLAN